jgi:mTERF domain-containing protein
LHRQPAATVPASHLRRRRHAPRPKLYPCPSSLVFRRLSNPIPSPPPHLRGGAGRFPKRFAAEEYLVATCGLSRAQALEAARKLSHVKSPTNPDAVLSFLAGLGLSSTDVTALVAKDPKFLCTGVERTLAPILAGLTGLGLSPSEITRLASLAPVRFRCRSIVSKTHYYLPIFGSFQSFLRVCSLNLLSSDLEKVVKPNVAFLQEECGLGVCDLASLSWILATKPERVRAMAARAESLGVPPSSGMFKEALQAVSFLSEEKIAVRVKYLKKMFRWSDAEVGFAVCKAPLVLARSRDILQSKSEFLISEVGLEPAYIAHRPVMLGLSLEGRLRPRYYVLKFLKENGLIQSGRDYFSAAVRSEKVFVKKYIYPHKDAAPHLAQDYADACRGQVPTRFRFA